MSGLANPPARETWPSLGDAERSALRELLVHGTLSRAELARRLSLSRTSLTRVTRRLVDLGLVAEGGTELRAWTGRPSEMLHVRRDAGHFLGVKLTGDSLFAVVTDLSAVVVDRVEEPLADRSIEHTLNHIAEVANTFGERHPGLVAMGVCMAGDFAMVGDRQVVLESHYLQWRDAPVQELLEQRVLLPVIVENDVRALTAAEHWFGAGAGFASFALVTVGVGIGTGFVVDHRLVTGHRGRAGRLDHLLVDASGPPCALGHRGCASSYLPSAAIVASLRTPGLDYAAATALARAGDPAAVRSFDDAARALGVVIGTVMNVFDPEKVVLTGDGLAVAQLGQDRMLRTIAEIRVAEDAEAVAIDVQEFEFTEWARAGAVLAIRAVLEF